MTIPERGSEQPQRDVGADGEGETEGGRGQETQRGRCQRWLYAPCESVNNLSRLLTGKIK